jgi:hypothetical protein
MASPDRTVFPKMTSMETSAHEEFAFGSDHLEGNSLPFRKIGTITNAGSTWLTQSYLRRSGGVTQPNGEYLAVGLNSAGQASSIPQNWAPPSVPTVNPVGLPPAPVGYLWFNHRYPDPIADQDKAFLRIRASVR